MIQRRSIWMAFFVLTLFTSTQSFASDVLLGGSGCTDSEIWKVGQAQLSKNEELAATLTEIPTSDSSAIKKWNQLRKFERTLAAMPGLTGAWAYWYYRAAFSMKMLAYAEAGFLDLDKKLTQGGPFSLATKSCIKVIQRNLQGLELSSSFVKQEKEDAEFFKALEGKELGPIYQKFKVLFQKARAEGSASRADGLLLLYSQELYRREKFKDAIASAKIVDKKSDRYPQALLVMAWSSFRLKDYAQSVGHAFSLMKLYPQTFEAMEGVWLASASFLEVCLEKEAQKTLEFFKGQVLEVDTWIKKNQAMIVKNPYDFYQANIQNKAVPFIVKREWLRSGRMYVLQNHLNSLIDEKEKAKDWKNEPNFYRMKEIDRQLNALTEYYKRELGKEFSRVVTQEIAQVESSVEKGQLLETDILGTLGQSQLQGSSNTATKTKTPISIARKVVWVRGNFEKGIGDRKEEVWLDDIGNFVGDFKNACKR